MDFIHQAGANAMYISISALLGFYIVLSAGGSRRFLAASYDSNVDGSELLLACFFALMTAHISDGSYRTTHSKTSKMKGSTGLTFIRAQLVFMLSALLSTPGSLPG